MLKDNAIWATSIVFIVDQPTHVEFTVASIGFNPMLMKKEKKKKKTKKKKKMMMMMMMMYQHTLESVNPFPNFGRFWDWMTRPVSGMMVVTW